MGLELAQGLGGVVNQGEASSLSTTELGSQTEDVALFLVGLVHLGELGAEFVLGDTGAVGVKDVTVDHNTSESTRQSLAQGPARTALCWRDGGLTPPSACGPGEGCG